MDAADMLYYVETEWPNLKKQTNRQLDCILEQLRARLPQRIYSCTQHNPEAKSVCSLTYTTPEAHRRPLQTAHGRSNDGSFSSPTHCWTLMFDEHWYLVFVFISTFVLWFSLSHHDSWPYLHFKSNPRKLEKKYKTYKLMSNLYQDCEWTEHGMGLQLEHEVTILSDRTLFLESTQYLCCFLNKITVECILHILDSGWSEG